MLNAPDAKIRQGHDVFIVDVFLGLTHPIHASRCGYNTMGWLATINVASWKECLVEADSFVKLQQVSRLFQAHSDDSFDSTL